MRITVFDVETTGLNPKTDRMVEIGIVHFDDFKERGSYGRIIRPYRNSCYVPYEAYVVHKISEEMIRRDGVLWTSIAEKVREELASADYWCAFNAEFDVGFIGEAMAGVGIELDPKPIIDPLKIAQRFIPYSVMRKKRLVDICDKFGILLDEAHRAVQDSRATGHALFALLDELELLNKIDELTKHHPLCWGKFQFEEQQHVDPFLALYNGLPRKSY